MMACSRQKQLLHRPPPSAPVTRHRVGIAMSVTTRLLRQGTHIDMSNRHKQIHPSA
ncbi:hypothetical protein TI01_2108 [Lysobacter sp. A03]|nr:hypothetical protein TI01_2108 [Lysobacter sp. A03]